MEFILSIQNRGNELERMRTDQKLHIFIPKRFTTMVDHQGVEKNCYVGTIATASKEHAEITLRRHSDYFEIELNKSKIYDSCRIVCIHIKYGNILKFVSMNRIESPCVYEPRAVCVCAQQAHNIKMTSYQRRCDVITSHRR